MGIDHMLDIESYGKRTEILLKNIFTIQDMGQYFGKGLYECELNYLKQYEWANNIDDILWRRSNLGLFMDTAEIKQLTKYFVKKK